MNKIQSSKKNLDILADVWSSRRCKAR